jgi:hypothetical protein
MRKFEDETFRNVYALTRGCEHCGEDYNDGDDLAELARDGEHKLVHAEPCAQELQKQGWTIA